MARLLLVAAVLATARNPPPPARHRYEHSTTKFSIYLVPRCVLLETGRWAIASAAAAADTAARVLAKSKAELARVRDEMAQQSEERDSDRRELRRLRSAVSAAGSLEEELAQRVGGKRF